VEIEKGEDGLFTKETYVTSEYSDGGWEWGWEGGQSQSCQTQRPLEQRRFRVILYWRFLLESSRFGWIIY